MIQTQATVIEKESIAQAWWRLTVSAPALSPKLQPGQFLLLRCGKDFTCYLRRPIYPQFLKDDKLAILVQPDPDPGMAWLSARQIGDTLDIIGPLGQGFLLPEGVNNLLLVSDSRILAPLLGQMELALAARLSVTLAMEGSRRAALYPVTALPPSVEFQAATLDGSLGHQGSVTDLLPELIRWADMVCAAGSPNLYRVLKKQAEEIRFGPQKGFMYALITDNLLACGVGACFGCAIETELGLKLTCVDGPVFDLAELNLEGTAYG